LSYLYFDIETVPIFDSKEEYFKLKDLIDRGKLTPESSKFLYYKMTKGMLNPHQGKVIAIAYAVDDGELEILKEWQLSERTMLQQFYDLADKATKKGWESKKPLTYVGFNILTFDIPFMFCRMQYHKVVTSIEAHDPLWLFRRLFQCSVDLLQIHLPFNDYKHEGLTHDALCVTYGLPTKGMRGKDLTDLYYREKYREIEDYVRREFIYPELFKKILSEGLTDEARFRSSVKTIQGEASSQRHKGSLGLV